MWGEGITEAEVVEWNVRVGDLVREDEVLGAVMTDKATVEIPSPVEGKITSIEGEIGAMTAVGATIITIEVEGEVAEETEQAPVSEAAVPATSSVPVPEVAHEPASVEPAGNAFERQLCPTCPSGSAATGRRKASCRTQRSTSGDGCGRAS